MANFSNKVAYSLVGIVALGLLGWYFFEKNIGVIEIPNEKPITEEGEGKIGSVEGITVPQGFKLNIFAKDLPDARVMEFDPKGRILVSQSTAGKITAVEDMDSDGVAEKNIELASGLNVPHGIAFKCTGQINPPKCNLYVAEKDALSVYDYDSENAILSNKKKLLDLPGGSVGRHFTRSLMFLAYPNENTLLISVSSSCNVCNENDKRRGSIQYYDVSTGESGEYAKGLRNSVFMALHPVSGKVFATEMGRDSLGDNLPPDEINIIEKGKNYGWPICYGKNVHDDNFDKNTYIRNPCMEPFEVPSYIDLPAHSAPLGLAFIPEEGWPEEWWYNMLVAYHGSWNKSEPTGYKIVRLKMDANGKYSGSEDFITGWLKGDDKTGEPVDIKILSGGTAYITDDQSGVIYRLSRTQ